MASLATITRRKRLIFSRRARTYRRALSTLHKTGTCTFAKIINMVGTYKTHRNAVDFDSAFLKALGDDGEVDHPGAAAHHETYHESVEYVQQAQQEFKVASVVNPSKGRNLKRDDSVVAESSRLREAKKRRMEFAVGWTKSVLARVLG